MDNKEIFVQEEYTSNDDALNFYGRTKKKLLAKFHKNKDDQPRKMHHMVSYGKYGYLFLIPFFLIFLIFNFLPLCSTIYYSFFEYYSSGLKEIGPNFIGVKNYQTLFSDHYFWSYIGNTMLIWICGFIPQIIVSLLLAIWFTDSRLKLKCAGFFKAIMYMPNLVMASAFGMMFLMFFSDGGPVNQILVSLGHAPISFVKSVGWNRAIISFINWLMWFGNTAILLMSGIMGIDESIFESARLDGSSSFKTFWHITMPLLMPIFVYVLITSLIGGIQLFDVAQIFTETTGGPNMTSKTIMMYLYTLITNSKNYGLSGAVSVILFLFTGILSIIIFRTLVPTYNALKQEKKAYKKRMRWLNSPDKYAKKEEETL